MSAVLHIKARWADSVMVAPAPAAKIVQTGDRWELILKIADNGAALSVYLRITSYNVCYTKLLRVLQNRRGRAHAAG